MEIDRPYVQQKTIDELCSVFGQRAPHAPPLPPDQTPNLDLLQVVYDNSWAPGLDAFIESGPSRWYATQGFNHLVSDRELLGQFLLYLTIVSNNSSDSQPDHPLVLSQEALISWSLLNLVSKPAQDGNEEAEKLARRVKAIEALLTGEPSPILRGSMADFIHQEDAASDTHSTPVPTQSVGSTFDQQLSRRSEDFWKLVEKFAETPRSHQQTLTAQDSTNPLNQCRSLRNNYENRDIIWSMMLLGSSNGQEGEITSRPGTAHGTGNGHSGNGSHHRAQEIALARHFLDNENNGRATNTVYQALAGMASRAFRQE